SPFGERDVFLINALIGRIHLRARGGARRDARELLDGAGGAAKRSAAVCELELRRIAGAHAHALFDLPAAQFHLALLPVRLPLLEELIGSGHVRVVSEAPSREGGGREQAGERYRQPGAPDRAHAPPSLSSRSGHRPKEGSAGVAWASRRRRWQDP